MSVEKKLFQNYKGNNVYSYTITNKSGAYLVLITYGGIMNRLFVPDRNGKLGDIINGFDCIEDYIADGSTYTGSLIGRYGNRISGGGFTLNGKRYDINNNEKGIDHLHGGNIGFNQKIWGGKIVSENSVAMTLFSPDGEEGYPGNLNVTVTYTFDDDNAVTINYQAVSDADTILNMTSHTYYNLGGYDGPSVMNHGLMINADTYDKVNAMLIPEGAPVDVAGTDFDFRTMRKIRIPYDHNFNINGKIGELRLGAKAYSEESGRTLTMYTDMPAVQLYTGEFMNGPTLLKGGVKQQSLHAFCLETQYSPDTPNRPYMPQCILKAGEKLDSTTKFVFGVE